MARSLNDWIGSFVDFTIKNTESPESYLVWAAVSTISSVLQRRVFMQWGHTPIYPNQYIVIVGHSGKTRKNEPLMISEELLTDVGNISLVSQSITGEALLKYMSNNPINYTSASGRFEVQSAVTAICGEMFSFVGKARDNGRFLVYLTDIYDFKKNSWRYETKNSGIFTIVKPCINILAATAPSWLPEMFGEDSVGGGFTSRCIFVVEEYKGRTIANPNKIPVDKALREKLLHDLEEIHILTGEMTFSKDALKLYEDWYTNEDARIRDGYMPVPDPRFGGYCARRGTHLKKIAMVMSASRGNSLKVDVVDFRRALSLMEITEARMHKAFAGLGRARYAQVTNEILEFIMKRKSVKRSEVLKAFFPGLDMFMLEAVERVLEGMKIIKVTHNPQKGEVLYEYVAPPPPPTEKAPDGQAPSGSNAGTPGP